MILLNKVFQQDMFHFFQISVNCCGNCPILSQFVSDLFLLSMYAGRESHSGIEHARADAHDFNHVACMTRLTPSVLKYLSFSLPEKQL